MANKFLLSVAIVLGSIFSVRAQYDVNDGAILDGKTIVKTNLLYDIIGSYNIIAERFLSRNISVQAGFSSLSADDHSFFPVASIPSAHTDMAKLSSTSFSLDCRIYVSETGNGHGFYFQPYFRHESHKLYNFILYPAKDSRQVDFVAATRIRANSLGLAMGVQWIVGAKKNIVIDWTILGTHYDRAANLMLEARESLNYKGGHGWQSDAEAMAENMNGLIDDFGGKPHKVQVDDSKRVLSYKSKIPYLWIRTGVSLGFRF